VRTAFRLGVPLWTLIVSALGALGACGQKSSGGASPYPASAPTGPCGAVVQQQAIEGFTHVAVCSVVDYGT